MRQIYPVTGPDLEVVAGGGDGPLPASVAALARLHPHQPGRLRANMVTSADGSATLGGRSGGLSGPADKMLFTVLRSLADVILVGAGTTRAEKYRLAQPRALWAGLRPAGAPPLPPVAVVSASLDLSGCERLLEAPPGPSQTIVITTAAAPAERRAALAGRARLIEAGDKRVDPAAAVAGLHGLGYTRILTEGGPVLLSQLTAAGLVSELCVTLSPLLAGGDGPRILSGPKAGPALRLAHVLADGDVLLCRYLTAPDSDSDSDSDS